MLGTILKPAIVGILLGTVFAFAAASEPADRKAGRAPDQNGSSPPAGKVALPPLPFARMPDTTMPKPPRLAPLPDGTAPANPEQR